MRAERPSQPMRVVVQRVTEASVHVGEDLVSKIGPGLLILIGVEPTDTDDDICWLAQKTSTLRVFSGPEGPWSESVQDGLRDVLVVSQFTLFASTKKGSKPSWHRAAKPEFAEMMCDRFVAELRRLLPRAPSVGRFGAMMEVALVNDGPVTIVIDSKARE